MTRYGRKVAVTFLALFLLSLSISTQAAQALNWMDLLLRGAQIIQISNISDQEEVALGAQIDQRLRQQVKISDNPQANELVKAIGAELVPYCDRPQLTYRFQVVEDPEINAFATLGGYVYVNTGTIAAADNRAQLAAVIAHEIGHIAGRHSLEQMKQAAIAEGILSLVGADRNELVRLGTAIGITLPRSREDEFDADRRGLFNLARAGYDPQAMPKFMAKLANNTMVDFNFLSTHPPVPDRIAFLNQLIQENNLQGSKGLDDTTYQQTWRNLPTKDRQKTPRGSKLRLRLW